MRVWDFDGVIFNSQRDNSDDFLVWNVHNKGLVASLPELNHQHMGSHESDILLVNRPKTQLDLIQEVLSYNNLYFDEIYFAEDFAKGKSKGTPLWMANILNKYYGAYLITSIPELTADDGNYLVEVTEFTPDLRHAFDNVKIGKTTLGV